MAAMSRRREREPERVWVTAPAAGLECSVCTEVFTDPVTLACGHTFCRACALSWFTMPAKLCPVARCPASANTQPAALPTQYALKDVIESLRVYCRFGLREDERGAWIPDPEGCPAQLSRAEAAAHEAACEHALEACHFAGCGVERRRRDAEAHDAEAAVAHARGERDARLALEASVDARFSALEARLAAGAAAAPRAAAGPTVRGKLQGHTSTITKCCWSPCGTMIVTASLDKTLKLWNAETLQCIATLDGHAEFVHCCAWSSDGRTIASGGTEKTVKLWSVETDSCVATLSGHNNWVSGLAWCPDGRSLASVGGDFKVWDVASRSCTTTLAHNADNGYLTCCSWSPDSQVVLVGWLNGTVTLFDVATRCCTKALPLHTGPVIHVAWSLSGLQFASASADAAVRMVLAAATVASASLQPTLRGHTNKVMSCAWRPGGGLIATCSLDTTIKLWETRSGNCIQTLAGGDNPDNTQRTCSWSPDGRVLASGGADQLLTLWDMPA